MTEESSVSDAEGSEDGAGAKCPGVVEYEPSYNRGPGGLEPTDAGIMRNKISQHQTVNKKRKIECFVSEKTAKAMALSALSVMGQGGVTGQYLFARNHASKKHAPIGPTTQKALDSIYGNEEAKNLEELAQIIEPKYQVGEGLPRGKNKSPAMPCDKAIVAGFKSQLQEMTFAPQRAKNMAGLGVDFINKMETKLAKCKGEDPTLDELKAACHLSLYNAWKCRHEPRPADFIPMNNDYDYDHDKESIWED